MLQRSDFHSSPSQCALRLLSESQTLTLPSDISISVFVQLRTSSIWLHLAVLIHGFGDKGNTGGGQISPG